jgi:hypothetical protein
MIWTRIGDMSGYESFDTVEEAADNLRNPTVGEVFGFTRGGICTQHFQGRNYISLFHGDNDANFERELTTAERATVRRIMKDAPIII